MADSTTPFQQAPLVAPAAPGQALPITNPADPIAAMEKAEPGPPCEEKISQLASGLQRNIDLTGGEFGSTEALLQILLQSKSADADPARFKPQKETLLGTLGQDIEQTRKNIKELPRGNPAGPGLNKVLSAQGDAQKTITAMTGNQDRDGPALATIKSTWASNQRLGMQNILDATQGCTPKDEAAAKSVQASKLMGLKAASPNKVGGVVGGVLGLVGSII